MINVFIKFDQSFISSREMLNNSHEGLMTQEGNSMSPATNQVELQKSDQIRQILSKYEDFIMTIENLKEPMNFEKIDLS
jgi:hypothetical protein